MLGRKGISLVEALVAVSISAVIGTAMWALIDNAVDTTNTFSDRQELNEALRQIQFILMRDTDCAQNMRGPGDTPIQFRANQRAAVDTISSPAQGGQNILLQSNQDFGRIRIGQITIEESTQNAAIQQQIIYENTTAIRYDVFFAVLTIPATSRNGRIMNPRQVPLKVFVPSVLQPAGTPPQPQEIRKCYVRNIENQTCGSFGGSFNNVSGTCDMPACDATTVQDDCPPQTWTCGPRAYFWGYVNDPATGIEGPRCICNQTCTPPAPTPY